MKSERNQITINEDSRTRIHPLLPTVKEAQQDPRVIYSDHVPILLELPLIGSKPIKIISSNVLGPRVGANGFNSNSHWEDGEESIDIDAHANQRYENLIAGYINGIDLHNVDVICLQEADKNYLEPILERKLKEAGKEWEIHIGGNSGTITLFNKKRFSLIKQKTDELERVHSVTLSDNQSNELVEIHNVWGRYNDFPNKTEKLFSKLLMKNQYVSGVITDSNVRIAPTDDSPRNITTGAIPIIFNNQLIGSNSDDIQMSDYPDGGFFWDPRTKCIKQIAHMAIDFKTAEIIEDNRRENEKNSWPEQRMVICLDDSYKYKKMADLDNCTIFEYETKLNTMVPENCMVRMASDSYNRKAIAIRFSPNSELYFYLKEQFKEIYPQIQFREIPVSANSNIKYPVIFVPTNELSLLNDAIKKFKNIHKPYDKRIFRCIQTVNKEIDSAVERMNNHENNKLYLMSISDDKNKKNIDERIQKCNNEWQNSMTEIKRFYILSILNFILQLIENHTYDLGFFGGIKHNGKSYSNSAYKIKEMIESTLKSTNNGLVPLTELSHKRLFKQIELELQDKCETTYSVLGFSGRKQSTVDLYRQICDIVKNPQKQPVAQIDTALSGAASASKMSKNSICFYGRYKKFSKIKDILKEEAKMTNFFKSLK